MAVSVLSCAALALVGVGVSGLARSGGHEALPVAVAPPESSSPAEPLTSEPASWDPEDSGSARSPVEVPSSVPGTFSFAAAPADATGSALLAVNALESNPINTAGLGTDGTTCVLPAFDTSTEGQDAYYQAALSCLNHAWKPVLNSANLPFRGPEVVNVTSEVRTPCGPRSPTQTALYCHGTIYMTSSYYRDVEGSDESAVYLGQLAHEYGHHVQELAGIMDASWDQRHEAGPESPRGYEISRRFELQATCYGGMFLAAVRGRGSVPDELVDQALADAGARGDDPAEDAPEHGSPPNNGLWARQGFDRNLTHQCNTWLAGEEAVR